MLIVGGYGIFYAYKENDQQKSSTKAVLLNKDFRQSLGFAIDRTNYAAQLNGKEVLIQLFVISLLNQTFFKQMVKISEQW